jgi:hypothetical protein
MTLFNHSVAGDELLTIDSSTSIMCEFPLERRRLVFGKDPHPGNSSLSNPALRLRHHWRVTNRMIM